MLGTMRDTDRDAVTGWIRNGNWYARQWDYLSGLGADLPCPIDRNALAAHFPSDMDQELLLEEAEADKKFCTELAEALKTSEAARALSISAKQAVANEFDPKFYPGTVGKWRRLRARARDMAEAIPAMVDQKVKGMTLEEKTAVLRGLIAGRRGVPTPEKLHERGGKSYLAPGHTKRNYPMWQQQIRDIPDAGYVFPLDGLGELGQWDIIGSLVGSIGGAASSVYQTKVIQDTQEDIAKIQAGAAIQSAQAQMSIANAQAAIAKAQLQQTAASSPVAAISSTLSTTVGGIPVWLIAIPVIGGVIWFFMKKRR